MITPSTKTSSWVRRKRRESLGGAVLSGRSRLRAPVHVLVQKWGKINLPFIKQRRFNGLRYWVLIHRWRPIAPKRGMLLQQENVV